jgi:hypothetical protein
MTNSIDRDQWLNVTSESRESQQIVRCIPYKLAFQTSCHLIYVPLRLKKKSWGWLRTSGSRYAKTICVKMWARKNKN